jgi:hypothetical protein
VAGCCEHYNEPLGSIIGGEFVDKLSDYRLHKKNCSLELVTIYLNFIEKCVPAI